MGYLKEKYSEGYFLNKDEDGNFLEVGVAGIDDFKKGGVREIDRLILNRIEFRDKKVIDLGFGRGESIKYALEHGAQKVTGVDFSESSFKIASKFLKKNNLRAELICQDSLEYFRNKKNKKSVEKFDIVLMFDFIEHVPRSEMKEILKLLCNFLSEKAIIVINTPVFGADNDVITEDLKDEARDTSDESEYTSGMHCNRYTRQSLRTFMKKNSYDAVSGHFFARGISFSEGKIGTKDSWEAFCRDGFPVKKEWKKEIFEYAVSSEESKESEKRNMDPLFIHDYNEHVLREINLEQFSMFVSPRYISHYIENEYEQFSSDLFKNFIKNGDTVVDIGAHFGYYSLLAAEKNKTGKIIAFEPVTENKKVVEKNSLLNKYKNIQIYDFAVSNESSKKEFQVTDASDSSGFYSHPLTKTKEKRLIKTISLDDFFSGLDEQKVDFIKIDTEGHEEYVLEGMRNIIARNPELKMLIEFNPKCLRRADTDPDVFLQRLVDLSLDVYILHDEKRQMYRITDDVTRWPDLISELEYVNLFCIKEKSNPFTLFLSHSATLNGAERSLLQLIKGLLKRGAIVSVIIPEEGPLLEEFRKLPIGIHLLSLPRLIKDDSDKNNLFNQIAQSCIEVTAEASRVRPDIIYTNTSVICQGAIAAKTLGVNHQWQVHEYGENDHGYNFLLGVDDRAKFIYENSDSIIFNSEALAHHFHQYIPNNKSFVDYQNIEVPEIFEPDNKKQYFKNPKALKVLLAGQIHSGKGQIDAVKAIKLFKNRVKGDIELIILGDVVSRIYFDEILHYIKENYLEDEIKIHKFVDDPCGYFRAADIVLMCSRSEAFGRVTVEALLMGKPVIGANRGGTKEIIEDGISGFLYEPSKEEELFNKLNYFYNNRKKIEEMGSKGKLIAEKKFSEEGYAGKNYERQKALLKKMKKSVTTNFISKVFANIEAGLERDTKSQVLCENNEEIEKDEIIQQKNQELQQRDQELDFMKSSKFWKLREINNKIKFALFHPWRFFKKYSSRSMTKSDKKIKTKKEEVIEEVASSDQCRDYVDFIVKNNINCSNEFVEIAENNYIQSNDNPKLIAFYLPQFHPIDLNDEAYGKGFTDWTNVTKAIPQFTGHYQPQLPIDVGFYDLRNIDTMKRQVELAKMYGIYGFCFYYYWFSGKKLLEKPILNWSENKDINFPFCLCWANENWAKLWDAGDAELLMKQELKDEDDEKFMSDILPFLKDRRYIKINNKTVLIIYRPHLFEKERARRLFDNFRNFAKKNGLGDLYLITANSHGFSDDPKDWGLDAVVEFPPHGLQKDVPLSAPDCFNNENFVGNVYNMQSYIEEKKYIYDAGYNTIFKTVFPSWDNTARKAYSGASVFGINPDLYKKWLEGVMEYTKKHNSQNEQFVFINAWNEWAEGAHLEPDNKYGYAYLKATRDVLEGNN